MATANLIAKSAAVVVTALIVGTVIPLAVVLLLMAVAPWGGPVKEMAHVTNVKHLTRLLAGLDEYDRALAHASPSR